MQISFWLRKMMMLYSEKALQIVFTSSQTYTIDSKWKSADVFLVNGGNAGLFGVDAKADNSNGQGGGGGYTLTQKNIDIINREIVVTVGNGGIAFYNPTPDSIVYGGDSSIIVNNTTIKPKSQLPDTHYYYNFIQDGGSGGGGESKVGSSTIPNGGTDGGNGSGYIRYGIGQGTTTKAFEMDEEPAYAGGGGGGELFFYPDSLSPGNGGVLGGGLGGYSNTSTYIKGQAGAANTGGGGGGGRGVYLSVTPSYPNHYLAGDGGSGIAIIRLYKNSSRPTNIDWTKNTITL